MKIRYKIEIVEFERGWGQRNLSTKYFKSEIKAEKYITNYNSDLPPRDKFGHAPDCYIQAMGPYSVKVPDHYEDEDET